VYPELDDEEVQLLELTELVRMARQPDAVAETVGAGEAVAVRLKETERHTVIKVVVRQLGKLPRKKNQEGARMAGSRTCGQRTARKGAGEARMGRRRH
jgi:hypothetical protein